MQNGPPIIRRSSLRRPTRGQLARRRAGVVIIVVLVLVGIWQFWPAGGSAGTNSAGPGGSTSQTTSAGPSASVIVPGENPIKHVIFLVKENHSFDNYFGKYPGADGATEGPTLKCDQGFAPGPTVPLTDAPYMYPHDLGHAFVPGLTAIDGGKMDGFNCVTYGDDLTGYTQFDRKTLPAYWALADRFTLADHFFTSMYGPTFPEHLYTIAAQSYGIVDNKTTGTEPGSGSYCDDPTEHTRRFPIEDLTNQDVKTIMGLENRFLADPANLFKIAAYWVDTRTCVNIPVLPDQLEQNNISWKYYATPDIWMNAMQAIKHVRFGPMWKKVQDPDTILTDLQNDRLPAGGQSERTSWWRREHLHRGELDGPVPERDLRLRRVAEHRGRHRLGRLRGLLRSRCATALRHHGAGAAHAGVDHFAVHRRGIEPRRRLDRPYGVRVLQRLAFHGGPPWARPDDRS
jgi:hypothetical protein